MATAPRKIDAANALQVRSFTADQVSRFVHGWYLAVERHSTGADDEEITALARKEADNLLQRLERTAALYELAVNPLLLTMIANVHRYRGALPGSRADLYQEIVQVMLVRRQEAKDLPVQLDGDKKEALLRRLAYAMMQQRVSDLPREEVLAEIRPTLRRLPRQITAEGFLADVGSNGLLIERETGLYCFAHHTLQEYLAAARVRDKGVADVLASAVDDTWWRETTLLYTARADADPIIAASLNSGTITALALAFDCADQGSEFAEDLRDRLESLLAEVSNPTTGQDRRHLITGVLLTRHLRQQIRTSDGTRICSRPITASLYRLFRDDTHTPAPDSPPSAAAGTESVVGVRASDAAAFAPWVNAVIGGEAAYNLPNRTALEDPATQRLITSEAIDPPYSIWSGHGHGAPELWVPSRACHPHRIDIATLTDHLSKDMARSIPTLTRLLLMRSAVTVSLFTSYLQHPDGNIFLSEDTAVATVGSALQRARTCARGGAIGSHPDLGLGRDLDGASDLYQSSSWVFAIDLANALTLERTSASGIDRTSAFGYSLDLAISLDQELALDNARAASHAVDLALDVTFDDVADRARGLDLAFSGHRDRDRVVALALNQDFDRAVSVDRGRSGAHNAPRVRFADPALLLDRVVAIRCSRIMGSALSQALANALHAPGHKSSWAEEFTRAFTESAGLSASSYLADPDTLSHRLTDSVRALRESLSEHGPTDESSWLSTVGHRLQRTADSVLNRQEQLTPSGATSIRLASLCLATGADGISQAKLREEFHVIAAGVTLLERRANGDAQATETIILATD
jgi:hypothetical protein